MENKNRLLHIEILQAFAIICVFIGHAFHIYSSSGWYSHKATFDLMSNIIVKSIYAFHMPLFVFLSGYLFYRNKDNITNALSYLKKRFNRLIKPFYLYGLLYLIPMIFLIDPMNKGILFYYEKFITLQNCWHLWFLPMLFLVSTFFLFYLKKYNLKNYFLIVALIILNLIKISKLPYCISAVTKYAIYFYLGCIFVYYKNYIENILIKYYSSFFLAFIIFEFLAYQLIHERVFYLATAIVSILFLYLTSKKLENIKILPNKLISYLSKNLFMLYILHEPIMAYVLKLLNWGEVYPPIITASIMLIIMIIIVTAIIFSISYLKKSYKH